MMGNLRCTAEEWSFPVPKREGRPELKGKFIAFKTFPAIEDIEYSCMKLFQLQLTPHEKRRIVSALRAMRQVEIEWYVGDDWEYG